MDKRRPGRSRRKGKARTEEVVGSTTTSERVSPKWRPHFERLLELRNAMLGRQADLTQDAIEEAPTFSSHIADAATDNYDRDLALGMLSSEQDALYEIEQALERIRSGTYGRCELSGKPIEKERLEAIPWTRFTAASEKELEREGRFKRAKLGPRETVTRTQPTTEDELS